MADNNAITLDHINAFFSLDVPLQQLNIVPTATGGAGINNIEQFPPPRQSTPSWRKGGTEYVKQILDRDREAERRRSQQNLMINSTLSVNTLDDVESTIIGGGGPALDDLQEETTQQIYSTYFNVPNRTYDPDLTITSYREEILQQLNIHPVVIIQGPTGCGKTTQVPQYILDYHQSKGVYCNIIVTQPRKIAAISIARRVCQERKWQLGSIVGYQVAMDSKTSTDTRLSYVTTGVFLEKLVTAKRMDMYTHVIIDEVHERNQDIDFALLLVKKFLKTNSQRVKVILMSATFDSSEFARYFSFSSRSDPAPILEITGKSKDVTEHYLHELSTLLPTIPVFDMDHPRLEPCLFDVVLKLIFIFDRIEKAEQQVPNDSNFAPSRGAVLIFLPGYEEICALTNKLQTASFNNNFWIIPLHSTITVEEQTKVFRKASPDQRKIIISTNIAESSITVPDVKYVIDFCLTKNLITDPISNYTCLKLEWASKSNCVQRKGRAGRVDIGKVYRLVPLAFYNKLPEYSIPEIKRCPLTNTILHIKKLNLCEPQEMLAYALDPPDIYDIGNAIQQLKEALALTSKGTDPFDGNLTFVGRVMANLPLDIKLSKLIIFGYVFHCLEECIIIAASLSLQSFFARSFQKDLDAYRSKLSWTDGTFSDCLCFLNAYKLWKQMSVQGQFKRPGGLRENNWAILNFIQIRRIKEVDLLVKEIKNRLEKLNIFVDRRERFANAEESNILILKMVIAGAFFPYYYIQQPLDEVQVSKDLNENDPRSTVLVTGLPPKHGILYATALKEMFACCDENISIEFEGCKAYIKFMTNNESNESLVKKAVYMALKMRKLRMKLSLALFSPEEAERKTRQLLSSRSSSSDNLFQSSNRITVSEETTYKEHPLPTLVQSHIHILITQVNNCGTFWARSVTDDAKEVINFLQTTINMHKGKDLKPLTREPKFNVLYLAPYAEGSEEPLYYRVRILEIKSNKVSVFYVDYGNVECIDISELRLIPRSTPDVLHTECLAFECHLAEIKPSSYKNPSGQWSPEANMWFKTQVSGQKLFAKVYSVVQNVIRVELVTRAEDGQIISLNKSLIDLEYAERAEESLASKQNHEQRDKIASYKSSNSIIFENNIAKDFEVSWREAKNYNDITKTGRTIELRGPYNPLEVSYCGLSNVDRFKSVKIERDSVNSVSLNAQYQDTYNSMLVASRVGVGHNTGELILRNTTLLPKLRGLPSIVCLLFAPYAEFRTDKARKSYTGALCGLGFNPMTGEPLYPDHDIEIAFDVEINLEDIMQINSIRMAFNLLLHSDCDALQYQTNPVSLIHEETRKTIINLLLKKRTPMEPKYYHRPGRWNQIPQDQLLDAQSEEGANDHDVLPLHRSAALVTFEMDEDLTEHLNNLYKMVKYGISTEYKLIRCKLCSVDLRSTRDLLLHLDSDKHVKKESSLHCKKR
ncbi:ATP-dependent RNA helicase TDRD9 like protein [Argiope bruennichi]|uniref:Probable ATP-dependent RNA helicase spindle-E n=1 Tax=Argiope bruennichi TaxID=94029 RepID=A0A8T0EK61_ARGBR|nr:ATP-dependent RNA helicase TDRD9 like protein [Argiope bruennichi]